MGEGSQKGAVMAGKNKTSRARHQKHRKETMHKLILNSRRWYKVYWRVNRIFISLGLEAGTTRSGNGKPEVGKKRGAHTPQKKEGKK